jgi:hypothetical protein
MSNRLLHTILILRLRFEEEPFSSGRTLDGGSLEEFEDSLAVDFDEHFAMQELQARSHASGLITTEEAQIIYASLGNVLHSTNGGWAPDVDLATKVTVTNVISELINAERKVRS